MNWNELCHDRHTVLSDHMRVQSCFHNSVGCGRKVERNILNTVCTPCENASYRSCDLKSGFVTAGDRRSRASIEYFESKNNYYGAVIGASPRNKI